MNLVAVNSPRLVNIYISPITLIVVKEYSWRLFENLTLIGIGVDPIVY